MPTSDDMEADGAPYDHRYLAGVLLFNRGDFFEAHEAWEALWMDTFGTDKAFYQGLIQAAVGLCHFCNGNLRGAAKLYRSSRDYHERYGAAYRGLDLAKFWGEMERCFAAILVADPPARCAVDESAIPEIELSPAPGEWPDPEPWMEEGH